jgi:hypothetical protein
MGGRFAADFPIIQQSYYFHLSTPTGTDERIYFPDFPDQLPPFF